jgi:hypothetical protein
VYDPKVGMGFSWELLRKSIVLSRGKGWAVNHQMLDMFWGDLVPVVHRGWVMVVIFAVLVAVLLAVKKWRAAVAVGGAGVMTVVVLGDLRVHSAWANVFYSGTRMFLAAPVVWALGMYWMDAGVGERLRRRWAAAVVRGVVIAGLGVLALCRHTELLKSPTPLVTEASVPPVERVDQLTSDARAVAAACAKHHATLVIVAPSAYTCLNDGGPVVTDGAIETLYPGFERRSFRVAEERMKRHTAVIVYMPGMMQMMWAARAFPGSRMVSRSPGMMLVTIPSPGKSGVEVAEGLGMTVRLKI